MMVRRWKQAFFKRTGSKNSELQKVMRQSWMVGRAAPSPPRDGTAVLVPLPLPDGGQGTARPTLPGAPMTDALLQKSDCRIQKDVRLLFRYLAKYRYARIHEHHQGAGG